MGGGSKKKKKTPDYEENQEVGINIHTKTGYELETTLNGSESILKSL